MIKGVYTAIITPFLPDGSLDEAGFLELLKLQSHAKVNGVVVLGTTGEAPTLATAEKKKIIQLARQALKKPVQLIVGTGSYSTSQTVHETKQAEEFGADGVLIVAPYYNKPTQEGLYLHYKTVAQSVKIPIIVYNVPGRTGQNIQTTTLKRLAELPTIVAVKETSGSIQQMMEVIEMILPERPDFKVLAGDDNLTLPLMALGGHGIISVVSNLVPEYVKNLYEACATNQWDKARKLHFELLPLFRAAFIETNPIPIKALMHLSGLPSGPCRLPMSPLMPENEKKLRQLHETLKLPLLEHAHG